MSNARRSGRGWIIQPANSIFAGGTMSALSVGTSTFADDQSKKLVEDAATKARLTGDEATKTVEAAAPTKEDGLSAIVKWVPGEVIGAYTAVVAALQPGGEDAKLVGTATSWLIGFCAAAALMTWLGGALAYRQARASGRMPNPKRVELGVRGLLSAAGLLLWSFIVPGSATNMADFVNQNAVTVVVPLGAIIFGLLAEFIVLPNSLKWLSNHL
jgi:hypothetical protein